MTDQAVNTLREDCSANGITIHPAIQPRNVPGAGLGVYTTKKFKPGEKLIHVPTKHIFTTAKIPESFLSIPARKHIAVHAQLAAFFAFGSKEDLHQYEHWMATWPGLDDFVESMPIFWGFWSEQILEKLGRPTPKPQKEMRGLTGDHLPKRRRISDEFEHGRGTNRRYIRTDGTDFTFYMWPPFCLSPGLCSWWHTSCNLESAKIDAMIEKVVAHVKSVAEALPELRITEDDEQLAKYLHAWCLVNTRCFYYIPSSPSQKHKAKPPTDPNEAMALCPFMDLFNHMPSPPSPETATSAATKDDIQRPCKARYTSTGFTVTTDSPIPPTKEILFCYGAHTNDALWLEYGFLLPDSTNTFDSIPLDNLIRQSLKPADTSTLEEHGYLNDYTLHNDGSICYRTEMVAWLLVLGRAKWKKVVEQGLDPEEACTSPTGKSKYKKTILSWFEKGRGLATENTMVLNEIVDDLLLEYFGTVSAVAAVQNKSSEEKLAVAKRRREMCLMRWAQISDMVEKGIKKIEAEDE